MRRRKLYFLQQEQSRQVLVSLQRHPSFVQHPQAHIQSFFPQQDSMAQPVFIFSVQHFSAAPAIPVARNIAAKSTKNSVFFMETPWVIYPLRVLLVKKRMTL